MGFYSELQMELDDYEARRGVRASSQAVEFCTKKVHAERRMKCYNKVVTKVANKIY